MFNQVSVEEVVSVKGRMDEFSELLVKVVDSGASIGFLPPMESSYAEDYWKSVIQPSVILFIATIDNKLVGSIQLHLCTKQNGSHRAEIAKLMTHPDFRRLGIARNLMEKAGERAKQEGRSLLILDTREGDVSNHLYTSLGYVEAGRIPNFAQSASGGLDTTVLYYKNI